MRFSATQNPTVPRDRGVTAARIESGPSHGAGWLNDEGATILPRRRRVACTRVARSWQAEEVTASEPDTDAPGEVTVARRGRPGYDQETVLRRAIEVFNRQGYDATSMGDLARELGLSKSAIYHHVPSKEHLLASGLDEALDALSSTVTAIAATSDEPAVTRLRTAVRSSVEILVDHLPAVTLLLRARGNSEVEQTALVRRRAIDDALAALVREAVREGSLRTDIEPELISRLLFGMVNSSVEWFHPGGSVDAAALADAITGIAFDGLTEQRPGSSHASKSTETSSETGSV